MLWPRGLNPNKPIDPINWLIQQLNLNGTRLKWGLVGSLRNIFIRYNFWNPQFHSSRFEEKHLKVKIEKVWGCISYFGNKGAWYLNIPKFRECNICLFACSSLRHQMKMERETEWRTSPSPLGLLRLKLLGCFYFLVSRRWSAVNLSNARAVRFSCSSNFIFSVHLSSPPMLNLGGPVLCRPR